MYSSLQHENEATILLDEYIVSISPRYRRKKKKKAGPDSTLLVSSVTGFVLIDSVRLDRWAEMVGFGMMR